MIIDGVDYCSYWPEWILGMDLRACCAAHDADFVNGTVTLQSHIDLGLCVVQTYGGPIAMVVGGLMTAGTAAWWLLVGRHRR